MGLFRCQGNKAKWLSSVWCFGIFGLDVVPQCVWLWPPVYGRPVDAMEMCGLPGNADTLCSAGGELQYGEVLRLKVSLFLFLRSTLFSSLSLSLVRSILSPSSFLSLHWLFPPSIIQPSHSTESSTLAPMLSSFISGPVQAAKTHSARSWTGGSYPGAPQH